MNPYLYLAAALGSALTGMEDAQEPPAPITGNAYEMPLPRVPADWGAAIDAFAESRLAPRIFHPQLIDNFLRTKRQEKFHFDQLSPEEQIELSLDTV